ncbi:hypothetical protein JYU34_018571, partial [Plutella xylostella]
MIESVTGQVPAHAAGTLGGRNERRGVGRGTFLLPNVEDNAAEVHEKVILGTAGGWTPSPNQEWFELI